MQCDECRIASDGEEEGEVEAEEEEAEEEEGEEAPYYVSVCVLCVTCVLCSAWCVL